MLFPRDPDLLAECALLVLTYASFIANRAPRLTERLVDRAAAMLEASAAVTRSEGTLPSLCV